MVERMKQKFRLGSLTEDDFDQDYAPGRADETMSAGHKSALDELVARTRRAADKLKKRDDQIVIVLEPK